MVVPNDADAERSEASDLPIPAYAPGCWAHVIAGTLGSWLPGDPRGFRSRRHRIHSSGDYKSPPPPGEHAPLHLHAKSIGHDAVRIPPKLRTIVGRAMLLKLGQMTAPTGALAVGATHAHALLAIGEADAVRVLGRAKQHASHAVRANMPGKLWSRSSHVVRVSSNGHLLAVAEYIANHASEGAWVWVHPTIDARIDSAGNARRRSPDSSGG